MTDRRGLRVATYNVHKCRGLDRRVRPGRIASVLREVEADIIALQEVVSVEDSAHDEQHQAKYIAEELGCEFRIDRKSTRLNSSHANISYAVFCLKKKHHHTRLRDH